MSDEHPTSFSRTIAQLEQWLSILQEAQVPSRELEFLQMFLTNATGYLSKDLSPDTEALENWETPENQAMIGRYITHMEHEIRLIVEEWQQTHMNESDAPLNAKLAAMLTTLEQGLHRPA